MLQSQHDPLSIVLLGASLDMIDSSMQFVLALSILYNYCQSKAASVCAIHDVERAARIPFSRTHDTGSLSGVTGLASC